MTDELASYVVADGCLIWRNSDSMLHRHPDKVRLCMHKLGAVSTGLISCGWVPGRYRHVNYK